MSENTIIIDAHTHLSSTRYIPDDFFRGIARNTQVSLRKNGVERDLDLLTNMVKSQHNDHEGQALLAEMKKANIEKSVLLLPDFTYCMQSELTIAEMYDEHFTLLKKHSTQFSVFAGVDPRWGADGVSLFEKGVTDYGFAGLKLYPPCGYSPSDPSLFPYYEICRQYSLPVLLHTGPTSPEMSFEFSAPELIDSAARNFQDVNFILAHGGVFNRDTVVDLCVFRPNVYLDLGGFTTINHPDGWQHALTELFRMGVNHKIIFGTDWPVARAPGGQKQLMSKFDKTLEAIPEKEKIYILSDNIKRITPRLLGGEAL
ncbi:amidohydrolase family protein [Teredinibacter purpureus]|jgi:Predicted metal-dependent hydrolase of the TIM-barrel fold|uniref:amidohydrolase family protein n=1 Tax=Teredinibacter purpureus TaxID=2731756 RepID=UPI000696E327|nr:amidohydrolase family protein [Teredinibacter purpureus]